MAYTVKFRRECDRDGCHEIAVMHVFTEDHRPLGIYCHECGITVLRIAQTGERERRVAAGLSVPADVKKGYVKSAKTLKREQEYRDIIEGRLKPFAERD